MSDSLLRRIRMLQVLPKCPRKLTVEKIENLLREDGYDIGRRSIQRDLISLSRIFPIHCDERDRSYGYGWCWEGDGVEGFPALDAASALACVLAGRFLEGVMPQEVRGRLLPNVERARNVLKEASRDNYGAWEDKVRIMPRSLQLRPPEVKAGVVDVVYDALLREKRFKAKYQTKGLAIEGQATSSQSKKDRSSEANPLSLARPGKAAEYEVSPLGLVHRHNVGYLVCTLYGYQNIVQLALHRFKSAALLEDSSVTAPEGFDLDDYIDTGEFSYPLAPRPVTLELAFEPAAGYHLYETPLAEDQQIKEKDGMLRVTAKIRPSQELLWWILGFGDMVEVIRPASLRRTLKGILEDAAGLYKD